MIGKRIGDALTILIGLGIIYIGVEYVVAPADIAPGFGFPDWPAGDGGGFLRLKGVYDIVFGIAPLALLILKQRRALGIVMLAESLAPFGDATTVLSHGGSVAIALGVHAATAVAVVIAGLLQLRAAGPALRPADSDPRSGHLDPTPARTAG